MAVTVRATTNCCWVPIQFLFGACMRYHFTISYPAEEFEQASIWLSRRAVDDPLLAIAKQVHDHYWVAVASSESTAKWQQEQFDAGRGVSSGLGLIDVYPDASVMRVDLECSDAVTDVMAGLLKDVFHQFPDYSVYDEDMNEDITNLVR